MTLPASPSPREAIEALIQAIELVERMEICGIDVDVPSPEEHAAIKGVIVVLQQFAQGYHDEEPQYRLSKALRAALASSPTPVHLPSCGVNNVGRCHNPHCPTEAAQEQP